MREGWSGAVLAGVTVTGVPIPVRRDPIRFRGRASGRARLELAARS